MIKPIIMMCIEEHIWRRQVKNFIEEELLPREKQRTLPKEELFVWENNREATRARGRADKENEWVV